MFEGYATGRKRNHMLSQYAMVLMLFVAGGCLCACSKSDANSAGQVVTSRQECLGVHNCVSVEMDVKYLKGSQAALHFKCPDNAPFLWNWDAERQRDVSIDLHEDTPNSALLHIVDSNAADVSMFKIFLGCSPNDVSERVVRVTHVSSGSLN